MGARNENDFFEYAYRYDNLRTVNTRTGSVHSLRLETKPSNDQKQIGEKNRYLLPRAFTYLNEQKSMALANQYQAGSLEAFALVLLEWMENEKNSSTQNDPLTFESRNEVETLRVSQRFFYPTLSSIPQELYAAREGKFLLTDEGSVFSTDSLERVAVLEAPIEAVASYGDHTIVLSAGRLLIYDQEWHLQGETQPSVPPQGLAVSGDTIFLFSMLSDQKIFVEKQEVNNFFKKRHGCFLSAEKLANHNPEKVFELDGATFSLAALDGCVLKLGENGKWQAWMGIQKNPAYVFPLLEKGLLLIADKRSRLVSVDLLHREETTIANFNLDLVNARQRGNLLELDMHEPGRAHDFLRRVTIDAQGKIVEDKEFWNRDLPE